MQVNLNKYKGKLPYASEILGVFQPLLGWKSRLIMNRVGTPQIPLSDFPRTAVLAMPLQGFTSSRTPTFMLGSDHQFSIAADCKVVSFEKIQVADGEGFNFVEDPDGPDLFLKDPMATQFVMPEYLESVIVRFLHGTIRADLIEHETDDRIFWANKWNELLKRESLIKLYKEALEFICNTAKNTTGGATEQPLPTVDDLASPMFKDRHLAFSYINRVLATFGAIPQTIEYLCNKEIFVARYLHDLLPKPEDNPEIVKYPENVNQLLLQVVPSFDLRKTLELLDPFYLSKGAGREAVLSPIGIIHLFRQYFFEFDNFLGPPVEHIWLSPGSTTELIEVSTRRVLQEKTFEQFAESILRTENTTTNEEELSQAVKDEDQKNTKLGSSLSGGASILIAHVEASGSMSIEETQRKAREENHRTKRQQSAKLSSEIRSNYKSSFRTITEVTDLRSKRYVIQNPTGDLINYELRRKMRQVGVQMQYFGTQLCWQTYVDDPGAQLGVSQLVHLASKADLSQFSHNPLKPLPAKEGITQVVTFLLPVPGPGERSNQAPIYAAAAGFVVGAIPGAVVAVSVEQVFEEFFGDGEEKGKNYAIDHPTKHIRQQYKVNLPEGFELVETAQKEDDGNPPYDPKILPLFKARSGKVPLRWRQNAGDLHGEPAPYYMNILNSSDGTLELVIKENAWVTPGEIIEFEGRITATPTPTMIAAITNENKKIDEENSTKDVEKDRKIKEEFVKSVKERVNFASKIKSRIHEDLREEERTVIFRELVRKLMREAWNLTVERNVAHLRSEMIKSIFDVDKMLYFVAPEWWQPRLHQSKLEVGADREDMATSLSAESKKALKKAYGIEASVNKLAAKAKLGTLGTEDLVGWGGEGRKDNYLITEDSDRAKLGSSLGWLLQLDGDNLRNAFLNAPWVKAVIPIRPGREQDALEWLKQSQVEGTDGLGEIYAGDDKEVFKTKYTQKYNVVKENLTLEEVLDLVAEDIKAMHVASTKVVKGQVEIEPGQTKDIFYLTPDEVFEKGFDPLKGGFKATLDSDPSEPDPNKKHPFKVFDQWIEVLPTDQIVAVEVEYDPKTGRQL
jgi:hypothetical protein